jgi:hypothetical protein
LKVVSSLDPAEGGVRQAVRSLLTAMERAGTKSHIGNTVNIWGVEKTALNGLWVPAHF